jgi:hypothetical protein
MLQKKPSEQCVMRFLVGILASIVRTHRQRRNLRLLAWLGLTFVGLLATFSLIFHWLMAREGQEHSWVTAVYWTFVTMSTLGFGDITFTSDAGRLFTIVVLITGTIFLLVLLPFSFIQFFSCLGWRRAKRLILRGRCRRKSAAMLCSHSLGRSKKPSCGCSPPEESSTA